MAPHQTGTVPPRKQAMVQDDLLKFDSKGQVTLLHITDMHAQLKPLYFRPPSENYGVGAFEGRPPHLVGEDFLAHFDIAPWNAACLCPYNGRLREPSANLWQAWRA